MSDSSLPTVAALFLVAWSATAQVPADAPVSSTAPVPSVETWPQLRARLLAIDATAPPYRMGGVIMPCQYECRFLTPLAQAAELVRLAPIRHREASEAETRAVLESDTVKVACTIRCQVDSMVLNNFAVLQTVIDGEYRYVQPLTCEQDAVAAFHPRIGQTILGTELPAHYAAGLLATFRWSEVPRNPPLFLLLVRDTGGEVRLYLDPERLR